ncbi:MAG: peptidylprolyl isomerase [Spirochaetia bacterium]|nr:peptidylprolyl isomerase [Spirochaetia bacterium]
MKIEKDKVVMIDYKLTGEDGSVIDTSDGREPLAYLHGNGGLIPGLESELEGKAVEDSFSVSIPPEKAYGTRDESLLYVIPRKEFEMSDQLKVGMQFQAQNESGIQLLTISKIDGDDITVDGNHPLAGETLNFDVTVKEIRDATAEELSHGHVHGPGGHQH